MVAEIFVSPPLRVRGGMMGVSSLILILSIVVVLSSFSAAVPVLTPEQGWGGSGSRTRRTRLEPNEINDFASSHGSGYSELPWPSSSFVDPRSHYYQSPSPYPYQLSDLSLGAVGSSSSSQVSHPEHGYAAPSHAWQGLPEQGTGHRYQSEQQDDQDQQDPLSDRETEEDKDGEGEAREDGQEDESDEDGFQDGDGRNDDHEEGIKSSAQRPSDFYTKTNIRLRREKISDKWEEEKLNFVDYDPEALAVAVRNLVVDGVPHKSILIQSAKRVVKSAPKWYSERYLSAQIWLTEKIADRNRSQRDTQWKANNKKYKTERRKQQQDERYSGIIARLQSQNLIDLTLPVDQLEESTRGLETDDLLPIVCTRAIKWYLEHYRSEGDSQKFVEARSKVRVRSRGGRKGREE